MEAQVSNELSTIVKESGIEITKAEAYAISFAPFMQKVNEVTDKAKEINYENPTPQDAILARKLRLELVPNRTGSEKKKDELKKGLMTETTLIQSLYNVVKNTSEMTENALMEVEKFQERREAERKARVKAEREAELSQYVDNASMFPLGDMTQEAYEQLLNGQMLAKQAAIEAERKAEELRAENERVQNLKASRHYELLGLGATYDKEKGIFTVLNKENADFSNIIKGDDLLVDGELWLNWIDEINATVAANAAYDEKIKAENERLRKEAEEKKKLAEERAKVLQPYIVFIRDYNALIQMPEEEFQKEFGDIKKGAELQWQADKEAAERKAKEEEQEKKRLADAEAETARLQKEIDDRKAEEEKRESDKQAAIEAEAAKGDKERYADLIIELEEIAGKYSFRSKKYRDAHASITEQLNTVINYAISKQ